MSQGRLFHRDALSLVEGLGRAWRSLVRRARGLCRSCAYPLHLSYCGAKRNCYHCEHDRALCHPCGKNANYAALYGYGGTMVHPNCRCVYGVDLATGPSKTVVGRWSLRDGQPYYEVEEVR